jgi:hypothetical protein
MSVLTKEDLIALSNNTFKDNEQGSIDPAEHRAFNNALINALMPDWKPITVLSYQYLMNTPVGLAYKDYGEFIFLKGAIQPIMSGTRDIFITMEENFDNNYIGIFNDTDGPNNEDYCINIIGNKIHIWVNKNSEFMWSDDSFNFSVILTKNIDNFILFYPLHRQ